MSTVQAILDNAAYHKRLLTSIAEFDYVSSALTQQKRYLADLVDQLDETNDKLEALTVHTQNQRKEHETLRDSTARKIAHRLTGKKDKFEAMASKEEHEYVEALENEMRERRNQTMLEQMVKEALQVEEDLREKAKIYEQSKEELATLYNFVFDGPSEGFPRDDELEQGLKLAEETHQRLLRQINSDSQAAELLSKAEALMRNCQLKMNEALQYSSWDMYGGGSMSDVMERNSLGAAGSFASQANVLVKQAQRTSELVQPVGTMTVPQIPMMGDIFFGNIFSEISARNKIQAAARQLNTSYAQIKKERDAATLRARSAGPDLEEAAQVTEETRHDLVAYRRETFRRVAEQSGIYTPPPSISEENLPPPAEDDDVPPPTYETVWDEAPSTAPAPSPHSSAWGSRNPYAAAMGGHEGS